MHLFYKFVDIPNGKAILPGFYFWVTAYFGLDGENGNTIEQIGMKYDLTKERIRQIKERAIKHLQKARYSNALKAYLG